MPVAGWRVSLPSNLTIFGGISHLILIVDALFPVSDPRVIAPEAPLNYLWPHIEPGGVLCLRPLARSVSPADRILKTLTDAVALGSCTESQRKIELQREFRTYWDRKAVQWPRFLSLVETGRGARPIWFYRFPEGRRFVFSGYKDSLKEWVTNQGGNPADRELQRTFLAMANPSPTPAEFPEVGRDVLSSGIREEIGKVIVPGHDFPILVETETETGPVFFGFLLSVPSEKSLKKGFRSMRKVPRDYILNAVAAKKVVRCRVERVDGKWVHGRDHDLDYPVLREKHVAIVGCGAIGGSVARLLAQAGVGQFTLIDHDEMVSANTSRHVLGHEYVGINKAEGLGHDLKKDFPHITKIIEKKERVEWKLPLSTSILRGADLIISAGLDLPGDAFIDQWRASIPEPPNWVCAWAEHFALAGHAVAIIDDKRLLEYFTEEGKPMFALTEWTEEANAMIREAGCGNSFQPHGAIDLNEIITMTARLALDVILGKLSTSCRRAWLGDRERVRDLRGIPSGLFDTSNTLRTFDL